jgi:arabinan endo-1,5-alpha-L-arabinosidase
MRNRVCVGLTLVAVGAVPPMSITARAAAPTAGESHRIAVASRLVSGQTDARVHDPSTIVQCKDEYWLFATGRGVRSMRSKDLAHWEAGPPVFSRGPAWTRDVVPDNWGYFWAPDVIRVGDRYLVYYSVSTWGKNTSAIGLASNRTLDPGDAAYRWNDEGIVIRSTAQDEFNAIDPNVVLDAEGRLWLVFGSCWSGIKLVELSPATGKRLAPDSPMHSLAHTEEIEAPCLVRHGDHYFLFVNWGLCCRGTNSTYNIRLGRSRDITGPYVDRDGKDLLHGGGTLFLGSTNSLIGPGHAALFSEEGTNWLSCHFYDRGGRDSSRLAVFRLQWEADGWPSAVSPPIRAPVAPETGGADDLTR